MTARAVEVADLVHDLDSARLTPRIDRGALKVGGLKAAALRSIADHADADIGERSSATQGRGAVRMSIPRMKLANDQVETGLRWRAVTRAARMRRPPLCGGSDVVGASLVVAFRDE
jgi:hypothetical protein